jgi:hypothetical protein
MLLAKCIIVYKSTLLQVVMEGKLFHIQTLEAIARGGEAMLLAKCIIVYKSTLLLVMMKGKLFRIQRLKAIARG